MTWERVIGWALAALIVIVVVVLLFRLAAAAFRIEPAKVLAFAKEPHAQTTYRFA